MSEKNLAHETDLNAIESQKDQKIHEDNNQDTYKKGPGFLITTSKGIKILSNLNPNAPEFYPLNRQNVLNKESEQQQPLTKLTVKTIIQKCSEKILCAPVTPTTTTITTTKSKSTNEEILFLHSINKPQISIISNDKICNDRGKGEPGEETLLHTNEKQNGVSSVRCHDVLDNIVVENAETMERAMGIRKLDEILCVQNIDEYQNNKANKISGEIKVELPFVNKCEINSMNKVPNCEDTSAGISNNNEKQKISIEKEKNRSPAKSLNEIKELFAMNMKKKNECVGDNSQGNHIMANNDLDMKLELEKIEKNVDKSNLTKLESQQSQEATNVLNKNSLNTAAGISNQIASGMVSETNAKTTLSSASIINRLKSSRISRPITTSESVSITTRATTRTITTPRILGASATKKITTLKTLTATTLLTNTTGVTSKTISGNQKSVASTKTNLYSKSLSGIQNKETSKSITTGTSRSLLSSRTRTITTSSSLKNPIKSNTSSSSSATSNISTSSSTKTNNALTSKGSTGIASKIGSALSAGSKKFTDAIPRLITSRTTTSSKQTTCQHSSQNPSASSSKEKVNTPITSRIGAIGKTKDSSLNCFRTNSPKSGTSLKNYRSVDSSAPTSAETTPKPVQSHNTTTTNFKAGSTLNRVS